MKMPTVPQPIDYYLDTPLECSCGRTHRADIRGVCVRAGAIETLPDYVRRFGYRFPFIVCDAITCKIAGERCRELLTAAGIESTLHVIGHMGFDEATLGELVEAIPMEADVVIAVGTGSITDMVRYMTYKLRLPCFTVATGAPMDGFAASIGILNVNNLKKTLPAHNTEVIIGDTDILKGAPYRMSVAGFGDLIGKLTCLNDWELSAIINDEHICPDIIRLVRECVSGVMKKTPLLRNRDPEVLGEIMSGLVLSGTAISLYGDSRPASGAEHHMSHYWETIMDQRHERASMHGEQVAVGTVCVLMLAEELRHIRPDFEAARSHADAWDEAAWTEEIRRAYGPAADEIIALEKEAGKNRPERVRARIDRMEERWGDIAALLERLPSADELIAVLRTVGSPATPEEIGIDRATLKDTFLYCKEVRARYTIFQTLYDLALLDELSERVIARFAEMNANRGE